MDPPLAAGLVTPSWKTFGNCIPTNPRSSWYTHAEYTSEADKIWGVPANTASTKIESSSVVHLEFVAMSSVEYWQKVGGMW